MRRADVIVIGAGILGATVAEECARRGLRVICLERSLPNREGSGTTAGNLHIQAIHARRPGQVTPVDTIRLVPLQVEASRLWEAVNDRLGNRIEMRRNGSLMVAETEEQVRDLRTKFQAERAVGLRTEMLDEVTIRQEFPYIGRSVVAGDYCSEDGYVNPLLVVPALLAQVRAQGGRNYEPRRGLWHQTQRDRIYS